MAQKTSSLICLQVSAVQIIGPPTAFHSDSFVTRFWCRMCRKRPQCGTSSPKWTTASITEQLFFFFFFPWQFGKLLLPANMMALTSGLNQPRRAPKRPVPWHCTKLLIWKAFLFHPVWGKISENELWPLLLGLLYSRRNSWHSEAITVFHPHIYLSRCIKECHTWSGYSIHSSLALTDSSTSSQIA